MSVSLALSIDPQNPFVVAGTDTHAFLKFVNDTPIEMNLALVIEGTLAAWVVPTPNTIDVPENGEATAALLLQPPAEAKPGPYLVTVRVLDQAEGSEQAQLSFAMTVQAAQPVAAPVAAAAAVSTAAVVPPQGASPALLLTLNQAAQTSPDSADFEIQVGNPTATATTAVLHAVDETNRLQLEIDPPQLILPAQGQAEAILHVTANAPLTGSEKQRAHAITVQAFGGEDGQEAQASTTFVQSQTANLMDKLPLILAAAGITLALLALLILFRDRGNESGTSNTIVIPVPVTVIPTQPQSGETAAPAQPGDTVTAIPAQSQGVVTAIPPPANEGAPTASEPTTGQGNPTVTVAEPSPIVVTPVPLPATPAPAPAGDGTFAVTGAVVSVEPQAAQQCPARFLFTAQVTASGPGRVQYQWEFSNGQNPPAAVMEFRAAGTTIAQVDQVLTQSQEGWGRVQFTDPVFDSSNQAAFVVSCSPAPSNELPATATP